jgi:hypothetical protein
LAFARKKNGVSTQVNGLDEREGSSAGANAYPPSSSPRMANQAQTRRSNWISHRSTPHTAQRISNTGCWTAEPLPMPDTADSRSLAERPLDELIACHECDLLMLKPDLALGRDN